MKFPKNIYKTQKPRMSNHRGRTWDCFNLVLPDGTKTDAHLDTTWGDFFYFVHEGQWFKGRLATFHTMMNETIRLDKPETFCYDF